MLDLYLLNNHLNNAMSQIKTVLLPSKILRKTDISTLSVQKRKLIFVGYDEREEFLCNSSIDIECLSPQKAIRQLRQKADESILVIVSPELYPCTLHSCKDFEYLNQKYTVSAFMELLLGYIEGEVFVPVYDSGSVLYRQYTSGPKSVFSVMSDYIIFLSKLGSNTEKTLDLLKYNIVINKEIHRLMTLQYYLNSLSRERRNSYSHLMSELLKKKKEAFQIKDDAHG